MRTIVIRWLMVTVVLIVAAPFAALAAGVQPPAFEPGTAGAGNPTVLLAWSALSSAVIAAVLVGLAARSTATGWTRAAGLVFVGFGIGPFAGLIEAFFFHVTDGPTTLRLLLMALISTGAAGALTAWLTPPPADAAAVPVRSWFPTARGLAIVAPLYTATYFAAGTLIYPFIESFYATRSLPPTATIAVVQLFVRGPFFAVVLAWIAATTRGSRLTRALWAGAALALLGGVAPLLMPNPYMPDVVRYAHFVETTSSNLLFGALAAWILQAGRYERGRTPMRLTGIAGASSRPGTSID